MSKVSVVVGGFLGDEGKGKITQFLLSRTRNQRTWLRKSSSLCIRPGGGANTGATIYVNGKPYGIHMLPVGAFMESVDSFIASGVYLRLDILCKEVETAVAENGNGGDIFISKRAHVICPHYMWWEEEREKQQGFGSTKQGTATAAAQKYKYAGLTLGDFLDERQEERIHKLIIRQHQINEIRDQIKFLQKHCQLVEPYEFFTEYVEPNGLDIVIEGTQGVGLDINHGFDYPYVSCGSFSTFGLLDGVGYALAPDEVVLVLKSYGSFFGEQNIAGQFDDEDFRKFAGEYGTTTKRPRKLAWLDTGLLKRVSSVVRPTAIAINRMDTINWFGENNKPWDIVIDGEQHISFTDKAYDGRLTAQGAMFIDTISEACDAPVRYLGVGPELTDIVEIE